jgi:hypothetical protein
MYRILIYSLTFFGVAASTIYWDVRFSYSDLKGFLDVLLNVSGAVFTLMGIWIAFLYPNALARIVDPKKIAVADFTESREEYARLTEIVGSVLKSAVVVLAIMGMNLAKVILPVFPWIAENIHVVKNVGLASSALLFVIQSDAVLGVIFANIMFLNDLHTKRAIKQVEEEY